LLLVYLVAGILIKRYKMGVESVPEVIPNFEFWAGIPPLVKVNRSRLYQGITKRLTHGTRNQESRKVLAVHLWNPDSWTLETGIQLTEFAIPLKRLESRIQYLKSRIHGVESRIQDCLDFPYMGRNLTTSYFCTLH